jgi:hypothetical protein
MDPISLVVAAVALGASAGLSETTTAVIKDAYSGLKKLLTRRNVDVSGVERRPDSPTQRAALTEMLNDTPDAIDDEVLAAARTLTDAVAAHTPDAAQVVGVNLRDVQAEFLRIGSVRSTGGGVAVERGRFTGGIDIGQVASGTAAPDGNGADPSRR